MSKRHACCLLIFCILYETEKTGITDHCSHLSLDHTAIDIDRYRDSLQLL